MDVIVVLFSLTFLIVVAYRGYSVILFAPVAALLAVALTSPALVLPFFSGLFLERMAGFIKLYTVASGSALFLSVGATHIVAEDSIPVLLGTGLGGSHHCDSNHEANCTSNSNEHNRRDYTQMLH